MKPAPFAYVWHASLKDALGELGPDGATKPLAGGQSLGPMMNLRLARPTRLVDVSRIGELRASHETDDAYHLGAATTHAEIEDGLFDAALAGFLRHVAGGIAYRAVRNKGTVGGSLAHADPAADWLTAMTAANARLVLARLAPGRSDPAERIVPIADFMRGAYTTVLDPDELLIRVVVPKRSTAVRWGYHKLNRKVGELANAIGAVVIDPGSGYARVVAGAAGSAPLVLAEATRRLAETAAAPRLAALLTEIEAALPHADAVKRQLLAVSVLRAIERAVQ